MPKFDTDREAEITCPYCGYKETDSWELTGEQEEISDVFCGSCEKEYKMMTMIDISYTTWIPTPYEIQKPKCEADNTYRISTERGYPMYVCNLGGGFCSDLRCPKIKGEQ